MKRWFKEFFFYPDVLVMVILLAVGLVWTVPQLASEEPSTWLKQHTEP
ncbi:hypothetical protein P4U44_02465 [Alkalihalobacillus alcalophilus]|nr:hypothetical protein [Alkalihalobacillus alcalophilus]MED1560774.1 hypothetical protein [Alkalihalobacillus alcalophilus]